MELHHTPRPVVGIPVGWGRLVAHSPGRPEDADSALSAVLEEQLLEAAAVGTVCTLLSPEEDLPGTGCLSWCPTETDTWRDGVWAVEGCHLACASLLCWVPLLYQSCDGSFSLLHVLQGLDHCKAS